MSNKNLTPKLIMKEFLAHVRNELVMIDLVYRDFDAEITARREGDTVYVRRPQNVVVSDGSNLVLQDVEQGEIPITVDQRKHVGLRFTSNDMNLNMPEFVRKANLKEAARAMAQQIDLSLSGLYNQVPNWVGTPGQLVNSISDFTKAPERLDELAVPSAERHAVLSTTDGWGLVNTQTGLNSADKLVSTAYTRGELGDLAGCMTYRTQQVRSHTVGAHAGTGNVYLSGQEVTYAAAADTWTQTLNTDNWTSGACTINKGDIITIADVYAVNPSNKDTLSFLKQFVVQETVSDTSGSIALTISPPIIVSGPYQTVSAAPLNNAVVTVLGTASTTYKQNMVFHRNAFAFVPVPLITDSSMPVVAQVTDSGNSTRLKGAQPGTGLSFRMVRQYDINTDNIITRIDCLYGVKAIRPELATRLSGTS